MAGGFNPGVRQTNDPSYLGSSQGTEKASLQPLAEVPGLRGALQSPDYKTNTSMATAIKGVGDLSETVVRLTDNIIKQNIDDELRVGIQSIRDSFGVGAASEKGSQLPSAVGAGGAEGTSLAKNDPTAGQPLAITRLGNKIEGLSEAYRQGALSNSAYYAKMEAYTREVIQQYPGYADIVRQKAAQAIGTDPANGLRSALLQDVTALQTKVQAQNDKWTTYERQNAQYIYSLYPNYDQLKAEGRAPSRDEIEGGVGRLQARDYSYQSRTAALALNKAGQAATEEEAVGIATQKAGDIAGNLMVAINNTMGIKSTGDFRQVLEDVQSGKRAPLTPDEQQQMKGVLAQLKQQYTAQWSKFINTPINQNSSQTVASLSNPTRLNAARDQGMQLIQSLEEGLLNDKYGAVTTTAAWNKAYTDAGEGDMLRKVKSAGVAAAGRKFFGDNGLQALILNQPDMQVAALDGLRQMGWGDMSKISDPDGRANSVVNTIDKFRQEGTNNGNLNRAVIHDTLYAIKNPDKLNDANGQSKAVQYMFGPNNRTLIEAFKDNQTQTRFFNDAVSPSVTAAVSKMSKADQQVYTNGVQDMFSSVYKSQVDYTNQITKNFKDNNNLELRFDPKEQKFYYEKTGGIVQGALNMLSPQQIVQTANSKLQGFNAAVGSMKEVWKMTGANPVQAMYQLLPVAGVEPGSPVYKAIQTAYDAENKPKE